MKTRARVPPDDQQPHPEGTPAPGAHPDRGDAMGLPFRERLPQPSLEYRSAIGKWLRAWRVRGRPRRPGDRDPSLVAGHLADRRGLLLDPRLPAGHRAARGGRGGADRHRDPRPRHAASARCRSTRRWPGGATPGRARSPCSRTCSRAGRARCWCCVLLGFAATDFVITMTLSAADAAKHAIENPFLKRVLGEHQVLVTLAILAVLAAVFLKGFTEAIGLAAAAALPYLALNLVVLGRGALGGDDAPHAARGLARRARRKGRPVPADRGRAPGLPEARAGPERLRDRRLRHAADRRRGGGPGAQSAHRRRAQGARRQHPEAPADRGRDHERHADPVELRHHAAHRTGGLPGGRQGQRARHRLPGPQVPRPRLRHRLRPLDDPHPRPRRRLGHGGTPPPDPPLPAALRHGAALGCALPAAGSGAVRRRRRHHADLRRGRGGAERRLRHGRAGADPVCRPGGHARAVAGATAGAGRLHRVPLPGVRLHPGRQLPGAPGRPDHRQHLHAAPDAGLRPQPLRTLGGAAHPARVLRGRRELAPGAGAAGQEGAPGAHRKLLGGGPAQEERRRSPGTTTCGGRSCSST